MPRFNMNWIYILVIAALAFFYFTNDNNGLQSAHSAQKETSYDEFKGGLCFLFLAENLFRLVVYLAAGLMTPAVLLLAAVSVPAAVAGVAVGGALSSRLPERGLNACAVVMFLLSGASILIKALFFGA